MVRRRGWVLLALLAGCRGEEALLDVDLRLADTVLVSTDRARVIVSAVDGAPFLPHAARSSGHTGVTASNLDVDGDGRVDFVLDLEPGFPFARLNRFALSTSVPVPALNVTVRAEVFNVLRNRMAKLGGAARGAAQERVQGLLAPGQLTRVPSLEPACVATCPDATLMVSAAASDASVSVMGATALVGANLTGIAPRRADLVVAAAHAAGTGGAPNAGRVSVFTSGGGTIAAAPATTLIGTGGDRAGTALVAGDLDGDGIDDLVIGAPGARSSRGAVFVIYGGSPLSPQVELAGLASAVYGPDAGDELGAALALADTDGDGRTEVWAGMPGAARALLIGARDLPRAGPGAGADSLPAARGPAGSRFGAAVAALETRLAAAAPLIADAQARTRGAVYLLGAHDLAAPPRAAGTWWLGRGGGFGAAVSWARLEGLAPSLAVAAPDEGGGVVYLLAPDPGATGEIAAERAAQALRARGGVGRLGAAMASLKHPLGDALLLGAPGSPAGQAFLLRGPTVSVAPALSLGADGRPAAAAFAGGARFAAAAAADDFDQDGALDVALVDGGTGAVSIFFGSWL